jgi:glucokinase
MTDDAGRVIAVDLGGTNIRVALVDTSGTTTGFVVAPTDAAKGPAAVVSRMLLMIRDSLAEAQVDASEVVAVGIGSPGPLDRISGVIHEAPNLPGWTNVRLADRIAEQVRLPVFLENDANAAALAEFSYGDNRGIDNMLYITVSTGVGGGLILGGKLWHGVYGSAGEFGHMTVDFEGPLCDCGNRGCIEKIASGPDMAEWSMAQVRAGVQSVLGAHMTDEPLTGRDVVEAAAGDDSLAVAALGRAGRAVGFGIVNVAHLVNLDLAVIGGGVANAGSMLLEPIRTTVTTHLLASTGPCLRVVPWSLGEDVGLLGAAASARARMAGL